MKKLILLFFIFTNTLIYSQNIDVLKLNNNEGVFKFYNGEEISIKLPLSDPFNIKVKNIELLDSNIYENNIKIGKYSKKRIKLNNGLKITFEKEGENVTVYKDNKIVIAKAILKINENYNYLESIIINQNNFENKILVEAWIIINTIYKLTVIKTDNSDDFLYGILIGGIISK